MAGDCTEALYGLCESMYQPNLEPDDLFETLAQCLLIRFAKKVMEEDASSERDRGLFDFLEASLRHKSDMVIYEAASAICSLTNVPPPHGSNRRPRRRTPRKRS